MDELINAMSNQDLMELEAKYPDNTSVVTLIEGILATREAEAVQAKAMEKFTKGIAKTFASLPHPDGIYNVYARWAEVDIPSGEPEVVEVIDTPAEVDKDGNIITPAIIVQDMRQPTVKGMAWVVEVNYAIKSSGSASDGTPKTSKRAITVYKREGLTLVNKGNYASASKACEAMSLPIGGDSANRVLARDGYITEAYDGTDFAS